MKKIVILGFALLVALLVTGNASAGNIIDTSNIFLMAYYSTGTNIDLSTAIQEFDFVTESTGQYVEGKLRISYDDPNGRNPGNIQDFERRDNVNTNILFASDVNVRVRSDGWIVTWLTNQQNLSDIVFWDDANANALPSNTTLGKAIWRITNRIGTNFSKNDLKYYSYQYPTANRLLIGGRALVADYNNGETYSFLIPSTNTIYDAKFLMSRYLYNNNIAIIKINTSNIFDKRSSTSGLFEYARYYINIIDIPRDSRHTIYMAAEDEYNGHHSTLKSAIAILYRTG